jgi:predicted nucleotidyltransferase
MAKGVGPIGGVVTISPEATSTAAVRTALCGLFETDQRIVAAWHYGSSLRSDYLAGASDIDILLVVTEDTTLDDHVELANEVRSRLGGAESTVLRLSEVNAAIHPGWSRHFFVNVSRCGVRLSYCQDLWMKIF